MRPDRLSALQWWLLRVALPLCALAAIAILLGRSEWDVRLLEPFFDRAAGEFPLRRAWFFDDVLHVGGKYLVLTAAVTAFFLSLLHWRNPRWREWRMRLLYLATCVAATAVIAGLWKQFSQQTTPWDTTRFGGREAWPAPVIVGSPGAHAASGFAWVALYYVGASLGARKRWPWLAPGLLLGSLFAVAQHVRGAHVPSHEPWALFIAWSVASGAAWLFRARGWLEWREVEEELEPAEFSPSLRAEPWLLGAAGTFLGAFIFETDLLLEEYSAQLADLHEWFEVGELMLMGPGLGIATFLVVERMLTTRERALERENAERQRRFQILGQMAASVAHEVRNPLHSLRLIVDEQRHDVPELANHPLRRELEGCLQRIDHAVDLVYSLARPGAEEGKSADLVAIVREGAAMLARAAPQGPTFVIERVPSRADVAAAPARVRIVVENILRNASHASRAGDRIDVQLLRDANLWILDVENPGSLDSDDGTPDHDGLGIGLSISRRIVADAGGRMQLSEREGHVHCVVHWPASNGVTA